MLRGTRCVGVKRSGIGVRHVGIGVRHVGIGVKHVGLGLLVALAFAPELAAAEASPKTFDVDTTGQLLQACTWNESDPLYVRMVTFCLGFVSAAVQYDFAVNEGDQSEMITCPPDSVTLTDGALTFIAWAKAHPELHAQLAVEGVMQAVGEKWPCKDTK